MKHTDEEIMEVAEQAGFYKDSPMYYDKEMLGKFFRLAYARGMLKQEKQMEQHWSDCAVHNEPAYLAGDCDCGGYNADKELLEAARAFYNGTVADSSVRIVTISNEHRDSVEDIGFRLRLAIQAKLDN